MNVRNLLFASSFSLFLTFSAQGQVYQKIENQYGPVLGYSTTSGVKILSIAGNKFKDLNRNGKLDRYEDWRLTAEERAKDLASKLSVDQIAGLMLYSRHQALPAPAFGFMGGTYQGKNYQEGLVSPWALTDQQREGVEQLSVAERHYKALMAGVDQFGGNNDKAPVLAAYELGVKEHGQNFMRQRFEASARRLLLNIFRVGLFENPYLDVKESQATVGNPLYMKEGYEAQVKSVVLLKNSDQQFPIRGRKKVYVPKMYSAAMKDWWGNYTPARLEYPVNIDLLRKYADLTDNPSEADLAVVFVQSPISSEGGYSERDRKNGGNGYVPISLQYGTYTASDARTESIAAGDPIIDPSIKNRSYKNKMVTAANVMDLQTILDTKDMMKGKPILVSVTANKPMVFAEFEKEVSGIILNFGVSTQAVLDVMFGKYEPSGLLPIQMPANMATVEKQAEDVPFDMEVYVDQAGHAYDFGYGLNWSGVIKDKRVGAFVRK